MLYLRVCFDKPDSSALRASERLAHRTYIASFLPEGGYVRVVQAGPMCGTDTDDTNVGSFMVVEADSIEAAQRFHNEDPFTKAGLFSRADLVRWDRHIGGGGTYVPNSSTAGH